MERTIFSAMELDALGEVMNISLGSSATAVSNMLDRRVDITTPTASMVTDELFEFGDMQPAVGVEINYISGLQGSNMMMLKKDDVRIIVGILMGSEIAEEDFELNDLTISAICEVMNQMMGAASTALSDFLARPVNISTPRSFKLDELDNFKESLFKTDDKDLVAVQFALHIENMSESRFINIMTSKLARELLDGFKMREEGETARDNLDEQTQQEVAQQPDLQQPVAAPAPPPPAQPTPPASQGDGNMSQEGIEMLMSGLVPSAPSAQSPAAPTPVAPGVPQAPPAQYIPQTDPKLINAQPVTLPALDFGNQLNQEQSQNLELIMSVPLEVSVEIGRARRKVEDILTFSKGSLVVLDKLAGDQVDLFVNGMCVAKGDVVVIDDSFGVRITEVLTQGKLLEMDIKNNYL